MVSKELLTQIKNLRVKPDQKKFSLQDFDTEYTGSKLNKEQAGALLEKGKEDLAILQDKLYVHNEYSVLIILQAMDAAGKDSTIKHILSGLNPTGVSVHSFKAPTSHELDHDYLWRHSLALPPRGEIAIHNRSHYENVLVTRVHPEYILGEHIPGINKLEDVNDKFWERRLKQINRFEKTLHQNGMVILKFFLHVSKDEQKKRFLERIDDPTKNWKFSIGDLKERARWDDYQYAYEQAIQTTSKDHAPWFIIPADDKWYARLAIATLIYDQFEKLNLSYPAANPALQSDLVKAKEILSAETEQKKKR